MRTASAQPHLRVPQIPTAQRAEHYLARLAPNDRTRFEALVRQAPTEAHRTAYWKALAAAHPVSDIEAFAGKIANFYEEELAQTLNLRGLIQQHGMSCEVTSAQVIRGERDPLYALDVRLSNRDIGKAHNNDPYQANWQLGNEQRLWLEKFGGRPGARGSDAPGASIWGDRSRELWETTEARTGLDWSDARMVGGQLTTGQLIDEVAAQVGRGIPTPLRVEPPPGVAGGAHAVVALKVHGTGEQQSFDVLDPWTGCVVPVTRDQMQNGEIPIHPWSTLKGYRPAADAAPVAPFADEPLPGLEDLPPPPPPIRPYYNANGIPAGTLKPLVARDAEGRFVRWVYEEHEFDWRGVPTKRYHVDENGQRVNDFATVSKWDARD